MRLVGPVVASWTPAQEVAGSNNLFKQKIYGTEFSGFSENIQGKLDGSALK